MTFKYIACFSPEFQLLDLFVRYRGLKSMVKDNFLLGINVQAIKWGSKILVELYTVDCYKGDPSRFHFPIAYLDFGGGVHFGCWRWIMCYVSL